MSATPADVIRRAASLRDTLQASFRDEAVRSIYLEATRIANRAAPQGPSGRADFDQKIDRLVTSPVFGLPIMALLLTAVFWLTVAGANVPSQLLASGCSTRGARPGGSPVSSGTASIAGSPGSSA